VSERERGGGRFSPDTNHTIGAELRRSTWTHNRSSWVLHLPARHRIGQGLQFKFLNNKIIDTVVLRLGKTNKSRSQFPAIQYSMYELKKSKEWSVSVIIWAGPFWWPGLEGLSLWPMETAEDDIYWAREEKSDIALMYHNTQRRAKDVVEEDCARQFG
jgi:hypothetical protein